MKLRTLKMRPDAIDEPDPRRSRGTLRVIEGATEIIEWPFPANGAQSGLGAIASESVAHDGFAVMAEIQTKRFHNGQVDAERYTAHVRANDSSPSAIMAALAEACRKLDDFRIAGGPDDQIILQISVRG
jgi:hypothetical protein